MFGSATLDVLIGLVLVYFFLAVLVSAFNEFLAGATGARATALEVGVRNLLDGEDHQGKDLAARLYAHPLVQSLHTRRWFKGSTAPKKPSYIPARLFRSALEDILLPADPSAGPRSLRALRESVGKLPESRTKTALLAIIAEAGGDLARARSAMERWFDDAMDRVSGWYKRQVQVIIFGIALVLSLALNADTFAITNRLAHNPEMRAFVVATAEQVARQTPPPTKEAPPAPSFEKVRATLGQLEDLQIPLGWPKGRDEVLGVLRNPEALLLKALGILVTAAAVSLGAPFWFDLLNKLVSLRSAGKPPPKAEVET